jgi:hypothetical protein
LPIQTGYNVSGAALEARTIKLAIGALALVAAVATGVGATLVASLFAGLAALTLSAGSGLAASLELLEADRRRGGRLAAWGALGLGWIVLAAMLLNEPLREPTGLRLLASALLVGGAALRAWRWQAHRACAAPGLAVALGFALLALAATWSGVLLPGGDAPITAIGVGCAFELFGTGSFWLGEAWARRDWQRAAGEQARLQVPGVIQMT